MTKRRIVRAASSLAFLGLLPLSYAACGSNKPEIDSEETQRQSNQPVINVKSSELQTAISGYASEHPNASLSEVVQFANNNLKSLGFNYEAELLSEERIDGKFLLRTRTGNFLFQAPHPADTDGCGSHFLDDIPVRRVSKDGIELVVNKISYSIAMPKELSFVKTRIIDSSDGQILAEVYEPRMTSFNLFGVTKDGGRILWKFELGPKAPKWWQKTKKEYPQLKGDAPYLVLAISETDLEFVDDPALMIERPKERPEGLRDVVLKHIPPDQRSYVLVGHFVSNGRAVSYPIPCT